MNTSSKNDVRVRIPPSPTGFLHFGTARMALFNWLFARQNNGKIIFRPEDTDRERSKPEFEQDIIEGLRWLGLDWDEGPDIGGPYAPYRQSERIGIYETYLKKLLEEDKAYYCFCSKEELEADKNAMISQGLAPKYSGKCRNLDIKQSEKRIKNGESAVIRLKIPETVIDFNDIIRGRISFDMSLIGDFVIAKNLKVPLYALAGVVDDYEMKITHVIRGEDIISSTPRQIAIQKALGFNEVKYAHLPLILAPDRSKLSKRYLETSLNDYRKKGYLADAVLNFIALLGWHPLNDKEIMSRHELAVEFDLKRVQKSGAIFNLEKLEWINSQHIKLLSTEKLIEELNNFIPEDWLKDKKFLIKVVDVEKDRMKNLVEFKDSADIFFNLPQYDGALLVWKNSSSEIAKTNLMKLLEKLKKMTETKFNKLELEQELIPIAEKLGKGEALWPLRVALSGKAASPGPFEIMDVLGKNESISRIESALTKLS